MSNVKKQAVIIAHNHPIGKVTPSKDDVEITRKLKVAGETLGMWVLDPIILRKKGCYSFKENSTA